MIQTVSFLPDYEQNALDQAIDRAFLALHVEEDLKPGMKVCLKPNLIAAKKPTEPVTTNPAVVQAVVSYLRKHGITDITLAESSGGIYNAETMQNTCRVCGMTSIEGLKINDDFSFQSVPCPEGFTNHSFNLITPVCEADYIISLAKCKTHAMTGISGGIKNLFGTIPGLQKPQMHYRFPDPSGFSNMLLELACVVAPQVTVIDAIDAMEGNGPTGGTSHPLSLLLAARDLFTQDYFMASLMGIDPDQVEMLRQAKERGLAHPDEIELTGDPLPEHLTPFSLPDSKKLDFSGSFPPFLQKPAMKIAGRLFRSYPKVDPDLCVGCGKCAESCPEQLIKIKDHKAHFQKKGCISCFCCQEMCPRKAISVKKAL